MIIIIFGLPGSGKSYFAQRLSEALNANYLSSDRIRKRLFPSPTYSDEEKEKVYQDMISKVDPDMKNRHTILDGTFYKISMRNKVLNKSSRLNIPTVWILVEAADEIIKQRLSEDRKESDADYKVHLQLKNEFDKINLEHLKLKSQDVDTMIAQALKYIELQTDIKLT